MPTNTLKNIPGVIDGHAHLFRGEDYVDRLLEAADRLGITRINISGHTNWLNMQTNEDVLRAAEEHPDRFIPFFFAQLGKDGPKEIERAKKDGFRGVKFTGPDFPYDDERAFDVYAAVHAAGLPAHFHCGMVAYVRGVFANSDWMRPLRLDAVARSFPDMPILLSHLGVPEYEMATTLARMIPNIYVDMTGNPRGGWYCSKPPEFIKSLFYWPDWHKKLIFGTDVAYELMDEVVQIHERLLSACELTEEMRHAIYRDNYREYLGELPSECNA